MTKRLKVIIAFALVYVVWGSTYLAIRFAIGTIPPFLMVGTRFVIAGAALYLFARWRGGARPTAMQWRNTAIAGGLMLMVGNGLLSWAELRVPSGLAALIVATVSLWMVLLTWWVGGPRPGRYAIVGIVVGLAGVALLVGRGKGAVDAVGALAVIAASIGWALGTVFIKRADRPASTFVMTGMEMLSGGAINIIVGLMTGESAHLHIAAISRASLLGLIYLIIFGSWVGYSAYTYLVENVTSPAQLGTYAYVNPCIALLLGWLIAGETIGARTIIAMGIIVGAVVLLTMQQASAQRPEATASPSASSMASSTK